MEEPNGEEQTPQRRSQTKKELDALGEVIRVLKPLTHEQRSKIIASANEFLKE